MMGRMIRGIHILLVLVASPYKSLLVIFLGVLGKTRHPGRKASGPLYSVTRMSYGKEAQGAGAAPFQPLKPRLSNPAKNLDPSHPSEDPILPGLPHRPLVSI